MKCGEERIRGWRREGARLERMLVGVVVEKREVRLKGIEDDLGREVEGAGGEGDEGRFGVVSGIWGDCNNR